MKNLLLLSLLLISSPVWACDSYEDCMKQGAARKIIENDCSDEDLHAGKCGQISSIHGNELQILTAIAYKLNEIEETINKRNLVKNEKI